MNIHICMHYYTVCGCSYACVNFNTCNNVILFIILHISNKFLKKNVGIEKIGVS